MFKPGDKVRVIKYGHPMWTTLEGYYSMAQFNADFQSELLYGVTGLIYPNEPIILNDDNGYLTIDSSPSLVGQEGIIEGSYYDLYPEHCNSNESVEENKHQYSINGIPSKSAWYNEDQLELI